MINDIKPEGKKLRAMRSRAVLVLLAAPWCLVFGGCRPAQAPAKEVKPLQPLIAETGDVAAPQSPPPDPTADARPSTEPPPGIQFSKVSDGEPTVLITEIPADAAVPVVLRLLDAAAKSYALMQKRPPADLNELVKSGLITCEPVAPAGQRFVLEAGKAGIKP
jgi:hypothetical protein